jgi:hypothetical protein
MTDLDWRPERQWRWTILGFILGYFTSNIVLSALEIKYSIIIPLIGAAAMSLIAWYLRFHEENFHDD